MTTYAVGEPVRLNQGDTFFRARCLKSDGDVLDVSAATTIQLVFRDPSGADTVKTATFSTSPSHVGDGSDGWIEYKDTAPELTDLEGRWKYWARVTLPTGGPYISDTISYNVKPEGAG